MPASRRELLRLLDSLEGPIRAAFLADALNITNRASIAAMERAIAANDLEALLRATGIRPGAWADLTESIRQAYIDSGVFIVSKDVPARFGMAFDWTNPRAERWLAEHSSQLVTRISNEQREAIRDVLNAGMRAGKNPRSVALDIVGRVSRETGKRAGGIVGLTSQQAQYVANARQELEALSNRYFGRTLRDRRFDKMVREAIESGQRLTKPDIDRIVGRYEARMLKHRGDMIARTEALASMNEASDEALRQVVDQGLAPPDSVERIWRHSFAGNERPGHLAMNGQSRGVDKPFNNPSTGAVLMHPGEGPPSEVVACRCYVEHRIDFVAVANAA